MIKAIDYKRHTINKFKNRMNNAIMKNINFGSYDVTVQIDLDIPNDGCSTQNYSYMYDGHLQSSVLIMFVHLYVR